MRKIFGILIALALVLSFSLVAVPAAANSVASSTIVFESQSGYTLTDNGDGTYSGVIPCKVDGAFDIYAEEGATAYMDDTPVVISNHDAWPTWNPDTPDWYQYSLCFYEEGGVQKWALRNHAGATAEHPWWDTAYWGEGGEPARGVPMSGIMNWDAMYAAETDTGAYLPGMGTAKYPGKAASHGGGSGYWDMDWSWGSEAVPLHFPGFAVEVTPSGSYTVTLTPAETRNTVESSTMIFEGDLTDADGGVYTGTIDMTEGEYYVAGGPGEGISTGGGFDVYAKNGAEAYVEGLGTWTIANHDAYSQSGPWGSWYDPDCADWNQYSLELTEDHWYLRYTATGESPMSGVMYWYGDGTGYAAETDPGTLKVDHGGTSTDPTEYTAGSAQEWGWHCGWGEERIPLELPGFAVEVTPGSYTVTLTPAEGPVKNLNTGVTYGTIQLAIDDAGAGHTLQVAAGTYDEAINVGGFAGLTISGVDKTQVTIKPSTTLDWNVGGYGSSRKAVFRIVASTNVVLQNMTMDFDLVKANGVNGILYWDSTGTVNNNILKNMSVSDAAGGYSEITSYYRADGYTAENRAEITISGNTFIDPGRLGACLHTYVDATITGNTFYKTIDDFGYAIELGSEATGTISSNTIYGYDTAALSDGSESGGIYVENCFTGSHTTPLTKDVSVTSNEVYDCQWGLFVGNEFDDYAGDVDIVLDLSNNDFHDNAIGGVGIADEDKESGSSVSITGSGNSLVDNGDYGYYIYTQGDGDITVSLTSEIITGHDTGVCVEDTAGESSTSSYSVSIQRSNITGNTDYGINNDVDTFILDATYNWWGDASGPYDPNGTNEVPPCTTDPSNEKNADGAGDEVSDNVDYCPWSEAEFPTVVTEAATSITNNSATLNMNYTMGNYGSVQVCFAYKKSTDSTWFYTDWVTKTAAGIHAEPLTGLASSTKYDFKAELKYEDIVLGETPIEGATLQFTTLTVPTVTTQAATDVSMFHATVNMDYTVGAYSPVQVRFAYKKSADTEWAYTDWVSKEADGTHAVKFSFMQLGLNTKYDFIAQLKYNDIVIEGTNLQFTTIGITDGCFIATAAYGTPTAEQIDVLREFRDVVLLKSTMGSQFVALYYQFSPPIADFIAGNELLRTLVRELLVDPIVWVVEATGDTWRN